MDKSGSSENNFLAVDVGNTSVDAAMFSNGGAPVDKWRAEGHVEVPLEHSDTLAGVLAESFSVVPQSAVVGSVAESRFSLSAAKAVENAFGLKPLMADCEMETGLEIVYENPGELGIDRLANAAALFSLTGGACIAVDLGTATTFDCVSSEGTYLGGAIAAGFDSFRKGLTLGAPALPVVPAEFPRSVLGSNTRDCIKSGTMFGYALMVDAMVKSLSSKMDSVPRVFATGGFSGLFSDRCETFSTTDPLLTLKGLVIILIKNGKLFSL
ncbi:MAG: type III pantothenate kinase [Candidatus Mycalebacterium zealandia]|nr:MAG: type III pantothenate kinase [Candidatus Mycalebacterium zealandia]